MRLGDLFEPAQRLDPLSAAQLEAFGAPVEAHGGAVPGAGDAKLQAGRALQGS